MMIFRSLRAFLVFLFFLPYIVALPFWISGVLHADDSRTSIKIGLVTTLTTAAGEIGEEMQNAVELARDEMGGTMAGLDIELFIEDDALRPEIGRQKTSKLVKRDDVDFVTGFIWSHVLLASQREVLRAGKFLIGTNAGPGQMAGKLCHPNFFSTSWQNDQNHMAMGHYLNEKGIEKLYIMAPNYAAGKAAAAGVMRTFAGELVGQDLTRWGADAQLDFSAELAKAAASNAEALFIFYPGKAGSAFLKQYQSLDLADTLPLYSVFTVDALSLPKLQAAEVTSVLGTQSAMFWSQDLDTPANRRFVAAYRARFGRYPSHYAAQTYDMMYLIESAVRAVDGNLDDTDAVRAALKAANFDSVRGQYTYLANHFPVQNFYLRRVHKDDAGDWVLRLDAKILDSTIDPHIQDCPLFEG